MGEMTADIVYKPGWFGVRRRRPYRWSVYDINSRRVAAGRSFDYSNAYREIEQIAELHGLVVELT